jgi:hypothetical protein
MNANQALEGFYPDESDRLNQNAFIDGSKTLPELLFHAQSYVSTLSTEDLPNSPLNKPKQAI